MASETAATTITSNTSLTDQPQSPSVSVVAPAYNEAPNLPDLVTQTSDALTGTPHEIIIVNDGSTDDTPHVLYHLAELFDQVTGIELARNYGQSCAIHAGIQHAIGDIICTIDADLQNDPHDIPDLIGTITEGYDCVSGRRVNRNDPLSKRVPSQIQTVLAKYTGPDIHDFGCTLKAYRADAIKAIELYGEGHRYIPAKLYDKGYSITEQPVNHRERQHGTSRYGAGRLVRGVLDLVFHWFWNRYSSRPLHIFGTAGIFMMTLGSLVGATAIIQKYLFGLPLAPRMPRLVLTALLLLFGLVLVVFGVLSEQLSKLYYLEKSPYRINQIIE